jgi:hypothetical protein
LLLSVYSPLLRVFVPGQIRGLCYSLSAALI